MGDLPFYLAENGWTGVFSDWRSDYLRGHAPAKYRSGRWPRGRFTEGRTAFCNLVLAACGRGLGCVQPRQRRTSTCPYLCLLYRCQPYRHFLFNARLTKPQTPQNRVILDKGSGTTVAVNVEGLLLDSNSRRPPDV